MPFGPPPPDAWTLARARSAWAYLRPIAPWAIGAPALGAVTLAAQTSTFAVLRTWIRAYWQAALHNRPKPTLPSAATASAPLVITLTHYAILFAVLFGLVGWMRFASSSIRVAAGARYPRPHSPAASLAILVPFLGPLIAWHASRDCLPTGHEARRSLGLGGHWSPSASWPRS